MSTLLLSPQQLINRKLELLYIEEIQRTTIAISVEIALPHLIDNIDDFILLSDEDNESDDVGDGYCFPRRV